MSNEIFNPARQAKTRTFFVALLLALGGASALQAQAYTPVAPKPAQLATAKTVFLSNSVLAPLGDSDKLFDNIYASIQRLNHFTIVGSPSEADLILEYSMAPYQNNRQTIFLRVMDPKTHAILWSTSDVGEAKDLYNTSGKKPKNDALSELANYLLDITKPQPTPKH